MILDHFTCQPQTDPNPPPRALLTCLVIGRDMVDIDIFLVASCDGPLPHRTT